MLFDFAPVNISFHNSSRQKTEVTCRFLGGTGTKRASHT